jgi:hypothetical protein
MPQKEKFVLRRYSVSLYIFYDSPNVVIHPVIQLRIIEAAGNVKPSEVRPV